jgi:hypothetical protein
MFTYDFDSRERDLKVDVWYKLNHEANERGSIGQEISLFVTSCNAVDLAFDEFDCIGPFLFLELVKDRDLPSIDYFHSRLLFSYHGVCRSRGHSEPLDTWIPPLLHR